MVSNLYFGLWSILNIPTMMSNNNVCLLESINEVEKGPTHQSNFLCFCIEVYNRNELVIC